MQSTSDAHLLRAYAVDGSEAAFAELVRRHADLVYCAALRQVGSPDLAKDVAQAVFMDLAGKATDLARELDPGSTVVGWLYRSARYESLNLRRGELRRWLREQQAMQHTEAHGTAPDWNALSPLLDEAMDELEPQDRDLLLLRFFQNQDLRTVGAAFGISDDAAQKRVSRAVEKLRALVSRRGLAASAAGLAAVLSTHAVHAAPAGLAAALTNFAATLPAALTTTVQTAVMTTAQKVLVATVVAAAIGSGFYQAHEAATLRDQISGLRGQQAPMMARVGELEAERSRLTTAVAALNAENNRLVGLAASGVKLRQQAVQLSEKTMRSLAGADPDIQEAMKWKENKDKLKQLFKDRPSQWIPELALLTEGDWLATARSVDLGTEEDIRKAMSGVRRDVENRFAMHLGESVRAYGRANDGKFPSTVSDLVQYLNPPADATWLERYAIKPANEVKGVSLGGDAVIAQKIPVDEEFDSQWVIGPGGSFGTRPFKRKPNEDLVDVLVPLIQRYEKEHKGRTPSDLSHLEPYVDTAEQKEAIRILKEADKAKAAGGKSQ